jgi:integrase
MATARAVATSSLGVPDRGIAMRHPRSDGQAALGALGCSQTATSRRGSGRSAAAVRAASAAAAHAVEMAHEGVPLVVIQRQLGHANLGITSIYLQGIDSAEIIDTVHGRPSPMISTSAGLQISR